MLRLLLFILLAVIIYRLLRPRKVLGGKSGAGDKTEKMLTCARCGVHFPQHEAVLDGDRIFCSEPHREAWTQSR